MSDLKVTVVHADERAERTVTTGTKAWELFADDADVIAARVDGELRDLAHELEDGDEVEGVAIDSRRRARHPAALDRARDGAGGPGPVTRTPSSASGRRSRDGFYYDFDVEIPFVPEDLEKIETRMRKIIKEGQRFSRRVTSDDDARERARRRALQARADRPQGRRQAERRGRGRERRGRWRRADHLRQPPTATASWPGRTCAAARTCRPPSGSRRSS